MSNAIIPQNLQAQIADAAADINREYELSKASALDAVRHGIECGKLLDATFALLAAGTREAWVKENCKFSYSSARNFVRLFKMGANALALGSVRHLYPSGRESREEQRKRDLKNFARRAKLTADPRTKSGGTKAAGSREISAPTPSAAAVFVPAPIKTTRTKEQKLQAEQRFLPGGEVHTALFGKTPGAALPAAPPSSPPSSPAQSSSAKPPSTERSRCFVISGYGAQDTLIQDLFAVGCYCRLQDPDELADVVNLDHRHDLRKAVRELRGWLEKLDDRLAATTAGDPKQRRSAKRTEARH